MVLPYQPAGVGLQLRYSTGFHSFVKQKYRVAKEEWQLSPLIKWLKSSF